MNGIQTDIRRRAHQSINRRLRKSLGRQTAECSQQEAERQTTSRRKNRRIITLDLYKYQLIANLQILVFILLSKSAIS